MNAPASIQTGLVEAHRIAIEDANRWRGHCVNLFARGEMSIGKALLAASPGKMPMLLSQKVEALRKLCPQGSKKHKAVADFRDLADERNAIVHGEGSIFVDQRGHWLLSLRSLGREKICTTTIVEDEATALTDRLRKVVQQLASLFPA